MMAVSVSWSPRLRLSRHRLASFRTPACTPLHNTPMQLRARSLVGGDSSPDVREALLHLMAHPSRTLLSMPDARRDALLASIASDTAQGLKDNQHTTFTRAHALGEGAPRLDEVCATSIAAHAARTGSMPAQLVLVGPGVDTRPWRLPLEGNAEGVRAFDVATAKAHALNEALAARTKAPRPPRRMRLRRLACDEGDWYDALVDDGYDPKSPSMWVLSPAAWWCDTNNSDDGGALATADELLAFDMVDQLVGKVALAAAKGSDVCGVLPVVDWPERGVSSVGELLARHGLLAGVRDQEDDEHDATAYPEGWCTFRAVQTLRSEAETDVFHTRVNAWGEDADEDFFENVS